ncbi:hypothetical protein G6F59_016735 [Rhizopus arrhizus]|nr:hypothetical protein G6F59_016735 [Rhizopus arrhizus]
MEDSEWVNLRNVQVVGYWRQYGAAMLNSDYDEFGGQERNLIEHCKFQGLRGLAIRSGDTRAVAAKTSSTVEILWDSESFWESLHVSEPKRWESGVQRRDAGPDYRQHQYRTGAQAQ